VATHAPASTATTTHTTVTATVHQRIRYRAAGSDATTNRVTSDQAGSCAPAMLLRARPSRSDSRATVTASGAEERMVDRSVATAW
jgi:hypothetical protein